MDLLKALILGIVQGATEFLPVSSSAHLVLVPWWFGWDLPPLVFDIVLHLGTLLAVLVYFWRDWLTLARAGLRMLLTRSTQDPDARLLLLIIAGTIPAAVIGYLFEDQFESAFSDPAGVAAQLWITALLLVFCERYHSSDRTLDTLTTGDAILVGLAQAAAIVPGISRSGSTIATGMARGYARPAAARFSFLLSAPIIFGAGSKQGLDVLTGDLIIGHDMISPMIVGFVSSAVVGFICIWGLLRMLQRRRLYGFAAYCAVFGTLSLLVALLS